MKIKLLDNYKEFEGPKSLYDIAQAISPSLAKKCIVGKVNGELKDMSFVVSEDSEVTFLTEGDEALHVLNHSCAHLMAEAIKELYPEACFGVGPAIEEGYYYDFYLGDKKLSEEDFKAIEKKMIEHINKAEVIERKEVSKAEALAIFANDKFKTEIINELPEGETITIYQQGNYCDLCRGPHVPKTNYIKHFKLLSIAGSYFKGDAKREQMQRIYGAAFFSEEALKDYLVILEERKARDHRRLGKQLGIFMFDDLVGRGLPMWLPNGFTVRRLLSDYIMDKEIAQGYKHVLTPSLGNVNLYITSGHWAHYKDDMFPKMDVDDESYVLRPMNCPHHMVMYRSQLHSYKELPLKIAEVAADFRFEASGALTGIERTRAFYQNDSHIFCMPTQIGQVFKEVTKLILDVYNDFGFKDYKFRLSLRDINDQEKYFGNDELWERSENELRQVLNELGVEYYEAIGEAAFYGPKLDVQVRSAIGHDVTLSTIQLDYQLPERFELTYIDEKGEKARPVVIHRAILGSLDRFIAFLIEETKGNFPLWLAPVQVKVIPVNLQFHKEFSDKLVSILRQNKIRVEEDYRDEKLGYKIREAQTQKIPYQLVIGDNEVANNTVTYRRYGEQAQTTVTVEEFVELIKKQTEERK